MAKKKTEVAKEAVETQETSEVTQSVSTEENSADAQKIASESNEEEVLDSTDSSNSVEEDEQLGEEGKDVSSEQVEKETVAEVQKNSEKGAKEEKAPGKWQLKPEKEGAVTKFFKFEASQARLFKIDNDFVKIIPYKRLKIRFAIVDESIEFDFENFKNYVKHMAHVALTGIRVDDIEINEQPEKREYILQKLYPIVDILVPYMRGAGKVVNSYKALINKLNEENKGKFFFKLRIESAVMIKVDTQKEINDCFLKGFAAASLQEFKRGEDNIETKIFMKATTFIEKNTDFNGRDVSNANDVLNINRLKMYTVDDEEKFTNQDYILPFRKTFSLVTYQISDKINGKLKVHRTLTRVRIRNVVVANVVVPIGVYITQKRDILMARKFEQFFVDTNAEMKNTSALESYADLPLNTFEMDKFRSDCDLMDQIIIENFSEPDDTPVPETTTNTTEEISDSVTVAPSE